MAIQQMASSVVFSTEICSLLTEKKALLDFVTDSFLSPSSIARSFDITTDQELIHLNTIRETSEIYFTNGSKNYLVCEHIANLAKIFMEEESWNNLISYLQNKTDKYLVFGAARALSAIMYNFTRPVLKQRISSMLKTLLNTEEVTMQNNLFELLISLLNRHGKIASNSRESQCGHVMVECKVSPIEDIFSCLCLALSSHWTALVYIFLEKECPSNNFLLLWKILSEKNLNEHHSSVFLNEDLVVNFLSIASRMPPVALKLYVDIISQIFCSSLKSNSWKCSRHSFLEENVSTAMNMNCLKWLPFQKVPSNFCTVTDKNQRLFQHEAVELNVTAKKIIFVIFNLLCEFTNAESLSEVLDQLIKFTVTHTNNRKDDSMHSWAIDLFIEYDDLLFGVMFTSIKIYCKLKELSLQDCHSKQAPVEKLNPHKTFVKFIQQIGYDHNEILSFLLSEETCCLVYLLWYLKLLLAEWTEFVMAHEILFTEKCEKELQSKCVAKSPEATVGLFTEKHERELLSKSAKNSENLKVRRLVSYPGSSSSDEEAELLSVEPEIPETEQLSVKKKGTEISDSSDKIPELLSVDPEISELLSVAHKETEISDYLKKRALKTLSVLVALERGIQKLVDLKEFPYNVKPLMKLLKRCSDKYVLLK